MTAGWLMDAGLAVAVVACALRIVLARGKVAAVVGFVALGLPLAVVWVRMGAIDVALTEAALVTGATGALLVSALARLEGAETEIEAGIPGRPLQVAAALLAAAAGLFLGLAVLVLPDPAPTLAPAAMRHLPALGTGNPVTGVMMTWRALDLLLGSVALVFAMIAVWSFAPDHAWGGAPGPMPLRTRPGWLVLLARVLAPMALLLGAYLAWLGADQPGGTFLCAAVIAGGLIILWLAGLARPPAVARRWLRVAAVAGPLVAIAVGLGGMVFADGFLAWPPPLAVPLINLVGATMTLSGAAVLAMLVAGPPERPAGDVA